MRQCPHCGGPAKFIRYEHEHTGLIFGKTCKVYKCENCEAEWKVKRTE